MDKFVTLNKAVGETPLSCVEAYRALHTELKGISMAYAGRLDPMASGKLLVLLGDECKNQTSYHGLDKEYEFSVLFGIESDSLDVLGRLQTSPIENSIETSLSAVQKSLVGDIMLPYPRFSSKTVQGKPLHTWTLEGRLDEIEIPTKESTVYSLELVNIDSLSRAEVVEQALLKVNSIPKVTDLRKAIGNDFRRVDVRADWGNILNDSSLPNTYTIANFSCVASSGTYMRSLASLIANKLNTCGLAWQIHRTRIGVYDNAHHTWTLEY